MIENLRRLTETTLRAKLEAAVAALKANDENLRIHTSALEELALQEKKAVEQNTKGMHLGCGCLSGCLVSLICFIGFWMAYAAIPGIMSILVRSAARLGVPRDDLLLYIVLLIGIASVIPISRSSWVKEDPKLRQQRLEKTAFNKERKETCDRQRPALEQTVSAANQELKEFLRQSESWRT